MHGERQSWWGDLSACEARALYHDLIPTPLLDDESSPYSLSERARMAISARHAARLYVRERAELPVTLGCELLDGVRTLMRGEGFQKEGLSTGQLWEKYAQLHGVHADELAAGVEGGAHDEAYMTILQKACTTNRHVDMLFTACPNDLRTPDEGI